MQLCGGIEAGGTKFVCGAGSASLGVVERAVIPTRGPDETLDEVVAFFDRVRADHELLAVGVGAFGPIGLAPGPTYGVIGSTPKSGWEGYDLIGRLAARLPCRLVLDTDVGVAALAEHRLGAARGLDDFVYVTIGTGIGGAVVADGRFVRGALHPELGHMRVPHDLARDPFPGICPYHGDCLEGLASGAAVAARVREQPNRDRRDPALRALVAEYVGLGLINVVYVVAPQRIVVGGGVVGDDVALLDSTAAALRSAAGGYAVSPAVADPRFVVPAELGRWAGVTGAILLAEDGAPT